MKNPLKKLFLALNILVSLLFVRITWAASEQTAWIRGSETSAQLYFSDSIEKMLELFKNWEAALKERGVESHFSLVQTILDVHSLF